MSRKTGLVTVVLGLVFLTLLGVPKAHDARANNLVRTRATRVIGTIQHIIGLSTGNAHVDIYSKTHGMRPVYLTSSSIIKRGTTILPLSSLQVGQYVQASCHPGQLGELQAAVIHIEKHAPFGRPVP